MQTDGMKYRLYDVIPGEGAPEKVILTADDHQRRFSGELADWPVSGAVPYAHDLQNDELVMAVDVDCNRVANAPFHWSALRSATRRVVVCRTDLRLALPNPIVSDPILVISPGRSGSTLLASLARGFGLRGLSEPGVYLETFLAMRAAASDGERRHIASVQACRHADLLAPLEDGRPILLKLHPYAVPGLSLTLPLLRQTPRIVALVRGFAPWSMSWAKAVQTSITHDVRLYAHFLETLAELSHKPVQLLVLRYEDLVSDPMVELERLAKFLDRPMDRTTATHILARDSQEGTVMSRNDVAARPASPRDPDILRLAWLLGRPAAAIEELGLQGYL
jgi:hypothetical protein